MQLFGIEVSIAGLKVARKLSGPETGFLASSLFRNVNTHPFWKLQTNYRKYGKNYGKKFAVITFAISKNVGLVWASVLYGFIF